MIILNTNRWLEKFDLLYIILNRLCRFNQFFLKNKKLLCWFSDIVMFSVFSRRYGRFHFLGVCSQRGVRVHTANSCPWTFPLKMKPVTDLKRREKTGDIDISENEHNNPQIHESFNQFINKLYKHLFLYLHLNIVNFFFQILLTSFPNSLNFSSNRLI